MLRKILILGFAPIIVCAQEAKEISSSIDKVVVYFTGSNIVRNASLDIKPGINEFKLVGLSQNLQPNSIQFQLSDQCSILSMTTAKNYLSVKKSGIKVEALEDSLEVLTWDLKKYNMEATAFQTEKSLLTNNVSRVGTNNMVSATELSNATNFYRLKIQEIDEKILKNERTVLRLNKVKERLAQQITSLKGEGQKYCSEIHLTIKSDKVLKENLEFSYYEPSSSWNPKYDIRKQSKSKSLRLDYKAAIVNNSHEAWDKVHLVLSTADPSRDNTKPNLEVWGLNFNYSGKGKVRRYSSSGSEGLLEKSEMKLNTIVSYADAYKPQDNTETIEISEFATDFVIKEAYTVPDNGFPIVADVKQHIIDSVSYYYYTVPKLRKDAFIIARIVDWADYNLLDGEASVYLDNKYVGKTPIETATANDTLELTLGIDEKVVVNKVKKVDHNAQKMIGLNRKESFEYQIMVRNNNSFPIEIEVVDQVPVAQESEIEVDVKQISGAEHDLVSGKLKWKLKITPNDSKKLDIGFSVKYPRGKAVVIRPSRSVACPKMLY
jgi:uncharacterized protein (TIGR02231 family)